MKFILIFAVLTMIVASPTQAETCIASVYSTRDPDQNGTKTASGIPLDDGKATVAHKSRPLRGFIRITNLQNGKWAWLQVSDRGPYIAGRCIDFSVKAAADLGCRGLCRVEVQ